MRAAFSLTVMVTLLVTGMALATNGMNMIGYGARASGMAGADVAVLTDCAGISGNPAVMGKTCDQSISAGVSLLMPSLEVSNEAMGLQIEGESQTFPLPHLAWSKQAGPSSPWIFGVEAYAQGGMGVDFQNFPTGPSSADEIRSNVMYMRLTGAASYRISDRFTAGLSAIGGYAGMEFSMFPETMGGIDVEGLSDIGYAGRLGLHYQATPCLGVGAVYTTETELQLDGGTATMNFGSQGGKVDYDARMIDFTWPGEAEFGVALEPSPQLLIALDAKWINWSSSMGVVGLEVSNPPQGFPEAPFPDGAGGATNTMNFQMNWEDQWVYAAGIEYRIDSRHMLRAGYNYGKNPVPDDYLSPLFPAIIEQHATLGYGLDLGNLAFDVAYERAFENSQENNNSDQMVNPFGPGIAVDHSQNTIHFQTSYSF